MVTARNHENRLKYFDVMADDKVDIFEAFSICVINWLLSISATSRCEQSYPDGSRRKRENKKRQATETERI